MAIGDVVTRSHSKHWQEHDGHCLCIGGFETVQHVLWDCPFFGQHAIKNVGRHQGSQRCLPLSSSLRFTFCRLNSPSDRLAFDRGPLHLVSGKPTVCVRMPPILSLMIAISGWSGGLR